MPFDAICVQALAIELRENLEGAKIDKVLQPGAKEIHLIMRSRQGDFRLLLSAGQNPRVHLTERVRENPLVPPMFCMLLRKHLLGARLFSVEQPELERVLTLGFNCVDEMGAPSQKYLVCELMSRFGNIILLNEEKRIIDCIKRVDSDITEGRPVLPGLFYRFPPVREDKLNPLEVRNSPEQILSDKWLLDNYIGLSPLICREIAHLGDFGKFMELVASKDFKPVMLYEGNKAKDISFMPITQYGESVSLEIYESFSKLLDDFYTEKEIERQTKERSGALMKRAEQMIQRIHKKISLQKNELLASRDREKLRQCGDLLMANLHNIKPGAEFAEVEDFYAAEQTIRKIKLNPSKSPQNNAALYYKNYQKAKNAEKALAEQIAAGERDIEYWESVVVEISNAKTEQDLLDIKEELEPPRRQKNKKEKPSKPMVFTSSEGIRFYAGRNNRQNDRLTFKLADREHIWMHAQKIPGCHVIVEASNPDEKTLHEAAVIAALYSKAKNNPKTPVDYTKVKYVKKPPGSKPGMVIYDKFKTIIADGRDYKAEKKESENA